MFNEKQLEAINTLKGNIRVIAGAGSGKTGCLVERYIKLYESGANPSNILCVTFTNKAATEMKERIEKKVGKLNHAQICTFHSFCLKLLREGIDYLGYPKDFVILDSNDQKSILKDLYKECKINYDEIEYKTAFGIIANRKLVDEMSLLNMVACDNTIKKEYFALKKRMLKGEYENKEDYKKLLKDCLFYGYLYKEQSAKGLDFNDLILLGVKLLQDNKSLLKKWQNKLEYIMVDEFQDASNRQFELVKMLSKKHGNLFVVGDPDQTIYSWRGAKPEILVNLDKNLPKVKTIIMNQNYRSTPEILDGANKIIAINQLRVEKDLFTENGNGDKIRYIHLENQDREGEWVANKVKELLKTYKPQDIAVLYRMHFLSRHVEENFIKMHIPYVIYSDINFYSRKEIKDVLAYLRLILNPDDDISLQRVINVPTRGIGDKKIEALKEYAEQYECSMWKALNHLYMSWGGKAAAMMENFITFITVFHGELKTEYNLLDFVKRVIDKSGYKKLIMNDLEQERRENIEELLLSIEELEEELTLDEYLQQITLLTNDDKNDKKEHVSMMTIHSAKGLEFPVVFVVGLSEGYLPSGHANDEDRLEEERRLAYVAYTRAKEQLYLTDSDGYDLNHRERETSRYITEIENDLEKVRVKETVGFRPKVFKRW